jgi:broad specificity phosphatase PhoE
VERSPHYASPGTAKLHGASGQHTGLNDLPLTQRGQRNARRLGNALQGRVFAKVFTSPLKRARDTCELAGFGALAEIDRDLVEWNYGEYESLGTEEIRANRPGWDLFQDRCPEGEAAEDAGVRADRVVERVRAVQQDVFIFSSGHFLRVLAVRWLGLEPEAAMATLSMLSYEHDNYHPAVKSWNDLHHLMHH